MRLYVVFINVDAALLEAVLDHARYFNKSLAYVFMASMVVSILLWSLLMTYQKGLCKWIGYYGLLVFAIGASALFSNTDMVSVGMFGVFIFVMASWLIVAGVLLIKQKPTH